MDDGKPAFDPSKPFDDASDSTKPPFDPSQSSETPAFSGSDGMAVAKTVYPALGPILSAFGHGAKDGWGETPIGLSPESVKWLSEKKIFGPAQGGYDNPFQAFNEMLAHTVVGAFDIAGKAGSAALGSYQAGVAETGEQIGMRKLGRDLAAMPEAFFGSPHPTGIRNLTPLKEGAPATDFHEWFSGSRVADQTGNPIPVYHGTSIETTKEGFTSFSEKRLGKASGAPSAKEAFFFSEDPDVARSYADSASAYEDMSILRAANKLTGGLYEKANERFLGIFGKSATTDGRIVTAAIDVKNPLIVDMEGKDFREESFHSVIQRAKEAGHDGVLFKNAIDPGYVDHPEVGGDLPSNIWAVFNPEQVRIAHFQRESNIDWTLPRDGSLPPAVAEAHDLGVVGPSKPDVSSLAPAERAAAEVPPPARTAAARASEDVRRGPIPGEPEKAGNIRLDQIGINADAKDVILDAAKNNDDFNQARQGNVPLAQVESLSGASGVPSEVLTGNDGLGRLMHNDAVVRTWLQAFHQASDEIAAQMATVARTGDEADVATLREMTLRFQHMQEQVSGLTAEAGRTLGVFREFYANKGKAEAIGKLIEDNPGLDAGSLKKLANAGKGLDKDQVPRFLHDSRQPTFWDKYLYYWVNALISGPITHIKYIGANAAFGAYEALVTTPIAGALGAARRAVSGGAEGVYAGEAAARSWGLLAGTPDAIKAAWTAAKNNVMTPFENEVAGKTVNPLTQIRPGAIGGNLGFALGIPGRSAAGIHSFFRFLGYRAEIEAQAYRQAAKEGLSPLDDAFWQRRATLADNPTEAMMNAGIENGNHLTFIGEQGEFGKAISRLANTRMGGPGGIQPFKLILPFTHIPGQILRAGLELTPAAFADTKMRADLLGKNGAVAADTQRARLIGGGAVSAMVANWAVNDNLTGAGPSDPAERARWLRTHEPYSVRLGGWWYSYNKFGPIGDLIGLVSNLVEVGPKVSEGDYTNAAGHIIKATSKMLEDEVGMQGLVNLIEALEDPDRKMGRFVAGQAASNLPYSSLLRQTASSGLPFSGGALGDPIMREAKTFIDQIRYTVPFARQDLLPKRDWLGQPMTNPGYASVIRQREVNADPVDMAVSQLRGFKPAPPLDRIGGVKLPPKMYDEYQATAGAMTRAGLEVMVRAPAWGEMPPGIREQIIHGMVEKARQTAGAMLQARHPELIMQGVIDRKDKINGIKPTKLKD